MTKTEDTKTKTSATDDTAAGIIAADEAAALELKLDGLIKAGVVTEKQIADAVSSWVYNTMMGDPSRAPLPLVSAGILAAVSEAMSEAAGIGWKQAKNRREIRSAAALKIVAFMFTGESAEHATVGEAIDDVWSLAMAWKEPPR